MNGWFFSRKYLFCESAKRCTDGSSQGELGPAGTGQGIEKHFKCGKWGSYNVTQYNQSMEEINTDKRFKNQKL